MEGVADEIRPTGSNAYRMITGDDAEDDRRHWDRLYNTKIYVFGQEPSRFLKKQIHFLKALHSGRALDLGMGEGRNAVFLAQKGFVVEGIDISEVALRKAKRLARKKQVTIYPIFADLSNYKIKQNTYHVILNFDYLQRNLIPEIKKGLKKNGLIIYENALDTPQTHLVHKKITHRPSLLATGELKELFKEFEILFYEEIKQKNITKACLIAKKIF